MNTAKNNSTRTCPVCLELHFKTFLLNNKGYHSIRQTQQTFFPDNPVGYDPDSGVSFPDFRKLALAYGIPYHHCSKHTQLARTISASLEGSGPRLCEIVIDETQRFAPKASAKLLDNGQVISPPLENMWPFLSREELLANMTTG